MTFTWKNHGGVLKFVTWLRILLFLNNGSTLHFGVKKLVNFVDFIKYDKDDEAHIILNCFELLFVQCRQFKLMRNWNVLEINFVVK